MIQASIITNRNYKGRSFWFLSWHSYSLDGLWNQKEGTKKVSVNHVLLVSQVKRTEFFGLLSHRGMAGFRLALDLYIHRMIEASSTWLASAIGILRNPQRSSFSMVERRASYFLPKYNYCNDRTDTAIQSYFPKQAANLDNNTKSDPSSSFFCSSRSLCIDVSCTTLINERAGFRKHCNHQPVQLISVTLSNYIKCRSNF